MMWWMTWRRLIMVISAALFITVLASQATLYKQMDLWLAETTQQPLVAKDFYFTDTVVVDIDEDSMARLSSEFGAWPYKRDVYSLVTDYLKDAGAKTIVYDILLSEPREGDGSFALSMQRTGNVILSGVALPFAPKRDAGYHAQLTALAWPISSAIPGKHWDDMTLPRMEFTPISAKQVRVGIINVVPDVDGILRRIPLFHESYGKYLPNAALAALFVHQPYPAVKYLPDGQRLQIGEYSWPVTDSGEIILQHPKNADPFLVMPFYKLVFAALGMPGYAISRDEIEGKTIFIGSATAILGDYSVTPHGIKSGLHIMALTYQNLAKNMVLRPHKPGWDLMLILVGVVFPLIAAHRRFQSIATMSLLAVVGIVGTYFISLGLLAFLKQQSALLFSITNSFTLYLLMILSRIKILYDEKQKLSYEKMAAEKASALKSKFLSHITHELRTPLTAIMGFNSLISENASLSPDEKKATKTIEKNSEHLLSLINNLLDQAKIEAGKMNLDIRPTAIRDVIGGVISTFEGLAAKKNVGIKVQYDICVPPILTFDGLRLRQIVINLLGNALKFTDRGHILIKVVWKNAWLETAVQDTGPGVALKAQDKIFMAFQQGDASVANAPAGTGLGLAISRHLAQLMGGTLSIESTLGAGSTFYLRIPAPVASGILPLATLTYPCAAEAELISLNVHEDSAGAASAIKQPQPTEKLRGCVLLVDDSEDSRVLFKNFFDKMGLVSVFAENGQVAVRIALAEQPDIILMDMEMPVMNGLEAVRLLRQHGYVKPVVALTAHANQAIHGALLEAGFDSCLSKPIKQNSLRQALAAILKTSPN